MCMHAEVTVDGPAQDPSEVDQQLSALFAAHHRRLYVLARRLSANADDAKDLVQETFLRATRCWRTIPPGAEEAWLVRVLINLCRDRWKQASTRARLDRHIDRVGHAAGDAERALVAHRLVWQAMAVLSPRRRAVLVLHELEGASVADIARLLGVASVTVRWHLARGRRDLRAFVLSAGAKR
jgi:RNA polymerase sigma-70 factor (ECF subfamily)